MELIELGIAQKNKELHLIKKCLVEITHKTLKPLNSLSFFFAVQIDYYWAGSREQEKFQALEWLIHYPLNYYGYLKLLNAFKILISIF